VYTGPNESILTTCWPIQALILGPERLLLRARPSSGEGPDQALTRRSEAWAYDDLVIERVPVLVLPGLAAGDGSTAAIRATLASQGHRVHRWNLGRNRPTPELADALRSRLFDLAERYEAPIAIVGWSLGGLYAHRLAEFAPNQVRSVTTLGSPLSDGNQLAGLTVPTTSIYSKNDRVVPWSTSVVDDRKSRHENVEVRSNHYTLGIDPAVMYVISDRVRRDPDRWEPFKSPALMRAAFPSRPAAR
jgi:hypothetical protein